MAHVILLGLKNEANGERGFYFSRKIFKGGLEEVQWLQTLWIHQWRMEQSCQSLIMEKK